MAPDESSEDSSFLAHYGNCIAAYEGTGTLTFKDDLEVECRFRAGQLSTGEVILLCDGMELDPYGDSACRLYDEWSPRFAAGFHGKTSEGFQVKVDGGFSFFNYLPNPPIDLAEAWAPYLVRELSVQEGTPEGIQQATYGLTNVEIIGTERIEGRPFSTLMPLSLNAKGGKVEIVVKPVQDRTGVMRELRAFRHMKVTAEATAWLSSQEDVERLDELMDAVCYLLSVARGTRVQWLFRHLHDSSGKIVSTTHYWRARASFCQLWAIQPRMMYGRATKDFVETAYPILVSRPDVYKPAINMYLDAKAEADSLEVRSAKMALAMEALKAAMLKHLHGVNEYIIPEQEFDQLLKDLESTVDSFLESRGLGNKSRKEIVGQVKALNRTSFRRLIKHLSTDIGLTMNAKDLDLFIQCRNSLVHKGQFYCVCASDTERKRCTPKPTGKAEYFFLVNFLDRIFLKLFGYSGPYMDWSSGYREWRNEV